MGRTSIGLALAAGVLGVAGLVGYGIGTAGTGNAATLVGHTTTDATGDSATGDAFTPGTVADASDWPRLARRFKVRANLMHGEVSVRTKNKGDKIVVLQRGAVQAYAGTTLTVASVDGFTQTWSVASDVRVVKNRQKSDTSAVTSGANVIVVGVREGDQRIARIIAIPKTSS